MSSLLKAFKITDVAGQVAMVILPMLLAILPLQRVWFWAGLPFTVGGWQVASFLLHLTQTQQPWVAKGRRVYGTLLAVLAVLGCIALAFKDFLIFYFFILSIAGIGMGILYFMISVDEMITVSRASEKAS